MEPDRFLFGFGVECFDLLGSNKDSNALVEDINGYSHDFLMELLDQLKKPETSQSCQIIEYETSKKISSKGVQCQICDAEFVSRKGLMQHHAKIHINLNKSVPCNSCAKFFKHKYALSFHVKQVHEKSTRVKCQLCSKVLYNKYAHKNHVKYCMISSSS